MKPVIEIFGADIMFLVKCFRDSLIVFHPFPERRIGQIDETEGGQNHEVWREIDTLPLFCHPSSSLAPGQRIVEKTSITSNPSPSWRNHSVNEVEISLPFPLSICVM